jgi:acyl carrier protein
MTENEVLAGVMALVEVFAPEAARVCAGALSEDVRLIADLGYDSLRMVEIALACEERFGVRLEVALLLDGDPTPQRIASLITRGLTPHSQARP